MSVSVCGGGRLGCDWASTLLRRSTCAGLRLLSTLEQKKSHSAD